MRQFGGRWSCLAGYCYEILEVLHINCKLTPKLSRRAYSKPSKVLLIFHKPYVMLTNIYSVFISHHPLPSCRPMTRVLLQSMPYLACHAWWDQIFIGSTSGSWVPFLEATLMVISFFKIFIFFNKVFGSFTCRKLSIRPIQECFWCGLNDV